ncbi:MAG: sulfatase family protein [Pirellulaceae bacterium]
MVVSLPNRRLVLVVLVWLMSAMGWGGVTASVAFASDRPNILFAIADDWSWPHAGAYGDRVVQTPTFDRLAREGALFHHAYVSSPSCTPSRGAILTGQWHWRLRAAANLWSVFPDEFTTFPEILERAGYQVGVTGKGWGPGRTQTPERPVAGHAFPSFQAFIQQRDPDKPFCFWLGSADPHRPYDLGSGKQLGIDVDRIEPFPCLPDVPVVRSDMADYYGEVQRFDRLVGAALQTLEQIGALDGTLVVMTSDNGMPFPRCKANLYDSGARMPLAIRWAEGCSGGRVVEDFVSFTDFAPTFLEAAGQPSTVEMTGRSLLGILRRELSAPIEPTRNFVLIGKERHCPAQERPERGGYPCRAIRTHEFLYIRNFAPDRWPAGTPDFHLAAFPGAWFGDCDNGPTKTFLVEHHQQDESMRQLYDLAFAKRPAEELYDLQRDPHQLQNVADRPEYAGTREDLAEKLTTALRESGDPRIVGGGEQFDAYEYLGGAPLHPDFK